MNLNGTFTQAQLGTFSSPGSTVTLSGTLIGGLTLNASTGSWILTVARSWEAPLTRAEVPNSRLPDGTLMNGVVVNGLMDLAGTGTSNFVQVDGGLTVNGTIFLGNGLFTSNGVLQFGDNTHAPGALEGNATVVMGGTNAGGSSLTNGWSGSGVQTLTIGPSVSIHGVFGGLFQLPGTSGNSIVIQGTVSADVAGGTIQLGDFGPVINDGTIQAINGGTIAGVGLINSPGQDDYGERLDIEPQLDLEQSRHNRLHQQHAESRRKLYASHSRQFRPHRRNSEPHGNLERRSQSRCRQRLMDAGWRHDQRRNRQYQRRVAARPRQLPRNTCRRDDQWQRRCHSTIGSSEVYRRAGPQRHDDHGAAPIRPPCYFGGQNVAAGSLTGNGTIVLASTSTGGDTIDNDSNLAGAGGTLTIGPNITIEGNTGGLHDDFATGTIVNQGTIIADVAGGTISIGNVNGTFSNQGTMQANSGTFQHTGAVQHRRLRNAFDQLGRLVSIGGNLTGNSTAFASSNPQGVIMFNGGHSSANPQLIEVMSQDLGNTAAGFKNNFVYGTIIVARQRRTRRSIGQRTRRPQCALCEFAAREHRLIP